jgi:hypothetical protein
MKNTILTRKQLWRRERAVNHEYYIEGTITIIEICIKNVKFSKVDTINFI